MCRCWDGIKNEIKAINGAKENYYGKDHMKVKLSSDDDLPLNKPLKFFFLSEFSSQALTIHRTAGEGRVPSFIPLYHVHPLTSSETFICNFACEMTITYF